MTCIICYGHGYIQKRSCFRVEISCYHQFTRFRINCDSVISTDGIMNITSFRICSNDSSNNSTNRIIFINNNCSVCNKENWRFINIHHMNCNILTFHKEFHIRYTDLDYICGCILIIQLIDNYQIH